MSDSDDFTAMNDPDFLAEYEPRAGHARSADRTVCGSSPSEFDRRAGAKWASAS